MTATTWRLVVVAGMALAAAPRIGSAQEPRAGDSRNDLAPPGAYVLVGGGVTEFMKDAVKDRFDTGGAWDVRLGIGDRFYLGGEVAYLGSYRSGVGSGPDLVTSGAEGVLRLQYPYASGGWLLEPFVFGGIGWSRFSLRDAPAGASGDDIGVVPFGGGFMVGRGGLLLDARFTYRSTFDEDLALAVNDRPKNLDQWAVGASIGYEF
jgi:hypothetical protein